MYCMFDDFSYLMNAFILLAKFEDGLDNMILVPDI